MDPILLLKSLVAIPSISRDEAAKAEFLAGFIKEMGFVPQRYGNNIVCYAAEYDSAKPTLLLNSHIDTVKPVAGWETDPHVPTEKDGRIIGLGANDAHASVVSLLAAFVRLAQKPQPYNLILALSCEEEVSGKEGMEKLVGILPHIDLAIVGEPTAMQLAIAEKGLMVLDCVASGVSGHAAREEGVNAIYKAIADIEWFKSYRFPKVSPSLGDVKMTVTIVNAGSQHNVVPDKCQFTVDVRLTECYTHQEVLDIVRANVNSEVTPRSTRLRPSGIAETHPFVERYKAVCGGRLFGSSTMSDQALMPFPSVKIGPGDSARSHTANEYILPSEITQAVELYFKLLDGFELPHSL